MTEIDVARALLKDTDVMKGLKEVKPKRYDYLEKMINMAVCDKEEVCWFCLVLMFRFMEMWGKR